MKTKRLLSLFLAIVMIFGMLPTFAAAEETLPSNLKAPLPAEVANDLAISGAGVSHVVDIPVNSSTYQNASGTVVSFNDNDTTSHMGMSAAMDLKNCANPGGAVSSLKYAGAVIPASEFIADGEWHIYKLADYTCPSTFGNFVEFNCGSQYCYLRSQNSGWHGIWTYNSLRDHVVDLYISYKISGPLVSENPPIWYIDRVIFVDICENYITEWTGGSDATCGSPATQFGTCPSCGNVYNKVIGDATGEHDFSGGYVWNADTGKYAVSCVNCDVSQIVDAAFPAPLPEEIISDLTASGTNIKHVVDVPVNESSFRNASGEVVSFLSADETSHMGMSAVMDLTGVDTNQAIKGIRFVGDIIPTTKADPNGMIIDGQWHIYKVEDHVMPASSYYYEFNLGYDRVIYAYLRGYNNYSAMLNQTVDYYLSYKIVDNRDSTGECCIYIDRAVFVVSCESCITEDAVWVEGTAATCTNGSTKYTTCPRCGEIYTVYNDDMLDHTFGEYQYDAATDMLVAKCVNCDATDSKAADLPSNLKAPLPAEVEADLEASGVDVSHVIDIPVNDSNFFNASGNVVSFAEDTASDLGKAAVMDLTKTSNPGGAVSYLKFGCAYLPASIQIPAADMIADGAYHVAKVADFEMATPSNGSNYGYMEFHAGNQYCNLRNSSQIYLLNGLIGHTVNVYISYKLSGPMGDFSNPPVIYIDRLMFVDSCINYLGDTAVTVESTCGAQGSISGTCSVCANAFTKALPTKEHNYGDPVYDEATYTYTAVCANGCGIDQITYPENLKAALPAEVIADLKVSGVDVSHVVDIPVNSSTYINASGSVVSFNDSDTTSVMGKSAVADLSMMANPGGGIGAIRFANAVFEYKNMTTDNQWHITKLDDHVLSESFGNYVQFDGGYVKSEGTFSVQYWNMRSAAGTVGLYNPLRGHTVDVYLSYKVSGALSTYPLVYIDRIIFVDSCENYVGEWSAATEATCTEPSTQSGVCIDCGETFVKEVSPALGHDFSEVAFSYETGYLTGSCPRCGEPLAETLPENFLAEMPAEILMDMEADNVPYTKVWDFRAMDSDHADILVHDEAATFDQVAGLAYAVSVDDPAVALPIHSQRLGTLKIKAEDINSGEYVWYKNTINMSADGLPSSMVYFYAWNIWNSDLHNVINTYLKGAQFDMWMLTKVETAPIDGNTEEVMRTVYFDRFVLVEKQSAVTHTVTLINDGVTETQTIYEGQHLPKPSVEKDGYALVGWYTNDGEAYEFYKVPVMSDLTLTAKWGHSVTFYDDAGVEIETKLVEHEALTTEPADLSIPDGYVVKWHIGSASGEEFDLSTAVTANLELYAVIEEEADSNIIASGYCGGEGDGTNLTWELTKDGTLTISGTGTMKEYSYGYDDAPWFSHRSDILKIIIEDNVTSVGSYAFYECGPRVGEYGGGEFYLLESNDTFEIKIGSSVASVGYCAFAYCESLTSIAIPNSMTSIGHYAFAGCESLSEIEIPNSVETIESGAFKHCLSLINVSLPNSLITIGDSAFEGCRILPAVIIPLSVTTINGRAFWECDALSSVYFEGNAPTITEAADAQATFDVDSATLYYIPGTTGWTDSDAYDAEAGTWNGYKLAAWESDDLPENLLAPLPAEVQEYLDAHDIGTEHVYDYGADSFTIVSPIEVVEDSETVLGSATKISAFAFGNPASFIGRDLPVNLYSSSNGMTTIGTISTEELSSNANQGYVLYSFEDILVPEMVPGYWWMFNWYLQNRRIAADLTQLIGKTVNFYVSMKIEGDPISGDTEETGPVYYVDRIIVVEQPTSDVTYVASNGTLQYETLAEAVEDAAENSTIELLANTDETVTVSKVLTINRNGFAASGLTAGENYVLTTTDETYTVAPGVIASGTCGGEGDGTNLTWRLTENGTLVVSGTGAMVEHTSSESYPWCEYKNQITSVVIEDGVTTVGYQAFSRFECLTSINIGNDVTTISEKAFEICYNVKSLTLGQSVTTIGKDAFLQNSGMETVTIPASVTSIGEWAFDCWESLHSVFFEGDAPEICDASFGFSLDTIFYYDPDMSGWTDSEYYEPDTDLWRETHFLSVKEEDAVAKTSVFFPTLEAAITAEGTWSDTIDLVKDTDEEIVVSLVYLPGVTINRNGFSAPNLTAGEGFKLTVTDDAYIIETDNTLASGYCGGEGDGTNLTWELTKDGTLTIEGTGAMADYTYNTMPWGAHRGSINKVIIADGVTTIGEYAFEYCDGLTSVTIPDSVTAINDMAFAECFSLTEITIPDSVHTIGSSAFNTCTALTSVIIPDGVITIRDGAFGFCTSLISVSIPNSVITIDEFAFGACTSLTNVEIPASVTTICNNAFSSCTSLASVYFEGNAPVMMGANLENASFDTDVATLYYIPGMTGWTDSEVYNAAAGTWNGYKLAVWEEMAPAYTVTFDTDGGSAVEAQTVKYGKTITKPATPTKDGYTFEGWYNGDVEFDITSAVTSDLALIAKWKMDPLYTVFSTETVELAPGITQDIKYATNSDGNQIVYYIATADITRDDVNVYANYKDNDPSKGWGMQSVLDQSNAAQAKYGDPESEQYIPNYNVIVSTNGDGFSMMNGEPNGLLVMGGVEYHAPNANGFFGILKDGTPVIGTTEEYNTIYKGNVQEGIAGFGSRLVKDGNICVSGSDSKTPRTAVGITAAGKVVLMVLDARESSWSVGAGMAEIAQIMYEVGCVDAINLDGGGSSTFVAKQPGEDALSVVNKPSDGFARSVASSLMVVSTTVTYKTEVDGIQYETLAEAVEAAAEGDTVTLLANTDEAVTVGKEVVISKNGFTATGITAAEGYEVIETATSYTVAEVNYEIGDGDKDLDNAIEDAKDPNNENPEVSIGGGSTSEDGNKSEIDIPVTVFIKVHGAGDKNIDLNIDCGIAGITFDSAALEEIVNNALDAAQIQLSVENNKDKKPHNNGAEVYEINLTVKGSTEGIWAGDDNKGSAKVKIHVGNKKKGVTVFYVDENGKNQKVEDARIEDGYVIFTAKHFSTYEIITTDAEEVSLPYTFKQNSAGTATSYTASLGVESQVEFNIGFTPVAVNGGTVNMRELAGKKGFGVLVWSEKTAPATEAEAVYANAEAVYDEPYVYDGKLRITTDGIPAKNMGDDISWRVFYTDGNGNYVYGSYKQNYNIARDFLTSNVNKTGSNAPNADAKALYIAMLNYGAAAQTSFGYKTDSLMNAGLTDAQKEPAWSSSLVRTTWGVDEEKTGNFVRDESIITSRTANLSLEGKISTNFRVMFSEAAAGAPVAKAEILIWTEADFLAADVLTEENATFISQMRLESDGKYLYEYNKAAPKEMFSAVFACAKITDTNGNVHYGGVAVYSPERYGYANYNKGTAEAHLSRCVVVYGDAARTYFGD